MPCPRDVIIREPNHIHLCHGRLRLDVWLCLEGRTTDTPQRERVARPCAFLPCRPRHSLPLPLSSQRIVAQDPKPREKDPTRLRLTPLTPLGGGDQQSSSPLIQVYLHPQAPRTQPPLPVPLYKKQTQKKYNAAGRPSFDSSTVPLSSPEPSAPGRRRRRRRRRRRPRRRRRAGAVPKHLPRRRRRRTGRELRQARGERK
jgi:hypothetical protein